MIIYKITNIVTGKIYIGQTTMSLKRRWAVHKAAKRTSPLTSSLKKHGTDKFIIEEIDRAASLEELSTLEIFYIKSLDSLYPKGYNLSSGGYSNKGCKAWNKGLKGLPAPKTAFKKGHKTWNAGQPQLSEETRKKQSIAKLGKHISPNTEFKTGQESAFKGRKHTLDSLLKISANGNRRAIMCVETGTVYASVLDASKLLDIAKSHLRRLVISGKQHKKTGLTFKYVE
jgi:group I intron endonuclease